MILGTFALLFLVFLVSLLAALRHYDLRQGGHVHAGCGLPVNVHGKANRHSADDDV